MKLYHGTRAVYVDRIRQEGLHAPSHVNAWTWYMLTTSPEQAAAYSPHDDSVVLEYDIPDDLLDALDGGLLGIPTEHNVYGFNAMAYGIPRGLPGSYLVAVHPAPGGQLSKTAAQAAITAAAQPWTLGPDDLPATFSWGPRTFTLKYDPHKRNHASQLGDDIIVVGPDFFQADTRLRRAILLHEIGHVLSDIGLKDPNGFSWRAVECLPSFGHLNGQTTPGEVTAEAYSVAIDEPEFLRENAPELLALITDAARAHGFPLTASKTATTLYHGTNAVAAEHIGRDGFRAVDTREIVRQIEDLYGLPIDSVWNHEFYRMARGRSGRDQAYFTTNPNVAASYAAEGGEALRQGLQAAWSILHYALPYVGTPEGDACDRWLRDQMDAHFRPAVVTVDLPLTETEERLAAHQIALSLPIPASAVLDVRTSAKTAGQQLYFHIGRPGLGVGTELIPGGPGGRSRMHQGPVRDEELLDWVWLSQDAETAVSYALYAQTHFSTDVAFYLARPNDRVEDRIGFHSGSDLPQKITKSAIVVAQFPLIYERFRTFDWTSWWLDAHPETRGIPNSYQIQYQVLEQWRSSTSQGTPLEIPGIGVVASKTARRPQGPQIGAAVSKTTGLHHPVYLNNYDHPLWGASHYVEMFDAEDPTLCIATLDIGVDDAIRMVEVASDYRRQGLATAMFNLAKQHLPDLHPSNVLTDDGEAWASHLGSKEAAWADVRAKAARIRRDGGVRVIASTGDTITAQVQGDNHVYQTSLLREPGTKSVAMWECFLPDAPVLMADGTERPISAVVPGDEVITHEGRIARVMRAEPKPYNGDIVTVRFRGDYRPLIATAGHEVYAANRDYALQGAGRDALYKTTGSTVPVLTPRDGWIPIEQLAASDYLSRSIVGLEEPLVVTCPAPLGNRAHGYTHDDLDVKVDTDLAYWLGWYMAEGSLVGRGHRVVFSLALDEGWVCERLDAIAQHHFGVVGTRRVRESTIDYRVSHFALAHLARTLIGTGSTTKRLAPAMLTLPLPEQESFMDAWVAGDGHAEPRGVTTLHAANETSLRQAREILGRLGVVANLRMAATNPGGLASTQNAGPIWRLQWAGGQRTISQFRQDGMIWHKITSVERGPYVGEVWDIEVEEDHSFRAYGMNVHNCSCPWAAYSWGRSGRWRKYEGRMCAHAMALVYEAQAQEWGGNNVTEGEGFAEEPFFYEAPPIKDDWRIDAPKPTGGDDLAKAAALLPQGLYHGTVHDLPIGTIRTAARPYTTDPDAQAYYPTEADGRVKLYRGVSDYGTGKNDPYLIFSNWDEFQALLDSEHDGRFGVWWGRQDEAMFYGSAVVVGALFRSEDLMFDDTSSGLIAPSGTRGEIVELYLDGQPVPVPAGRRVTAGLFPIEDDWETQEAAGTSNWHNGIYAGTLDADAVGYRAMGDIEELRTAFRQGRWQSDKRFTLGFEGATQFTTDPNEVVRFNGAKVIVEVDLHGLPFKVIQPPVEKAGQWFAEGNLGEGLGVEGDIPARRILRVGIIKSGAIEWHEVYDFLDPDGPGWKNSLGAVEATRGLPFKDMWDTTGIVFRIVAIIPDLGMYPGNGPRDTATMALRKMTFEETSQGWASFARNLLSDSNGSSGSSVIRDFHDRITYYALCAEGRGPNGKGEKWVCGESDSLNGNWDAPRRKMRGGYSDDWEVNTSFLNHAHYDNADAFRKYLAEELAGVNIDDSQFADVSKTKPTTVYRGISLPVGTDPMNASTDRHSGFGHSWSLSLEAAQAIAERDGAGFNSDNRTKDAYSFNALRPEKDYVPVVYKASVVISGGDGNPDTYRPWTIDYASEREVDIPDGSEVTITGYQVAKAIVVSPSQKEKASKSTDLYGAEAYYLVRFEWPSSFQSFNKRVIASTNTIYRGLRVDLPGSVHAQIEALLAPPMEEYEIDQERKVGKVIVDYLQGDHWDAEMGLGRHWSTRKEMAETAALAGAQSGVGIVLTATYTPSGVDVEYTQAHPEFRDAESEITLRPGAQVTITNVELPYWRGTKGLDLIDGPIRATASKDSDFLRTLSITESGDSADQTRKLQVVDPSGAEVAYIAVYGRYYKKAKGEVADIYVSPAFRRRGVATWLFAQAQGWWKDLDVKHSKDLTDDGRAWKKTLGASTGSTVYRGACIAITDLAVAKRYMEACASGDQRTAADIIVRQITSGDRSQWWNGGQSDPGRGVGTWWSTSERIARQYSYDSSFDQPGIPVVFEARSSADWGESEEDAGGTWWWHIEPGSAVNLTRAVAEIRGRDEAQGCLESFAGQGQWATISEFGGIPRDGIDIELPISALPRTATKDPRFEGVALKQDDDGKWYVTTHRARSDSYDSPEDIPQSDVDFIESTGSLHMTKTHTAKRNNAFGMVIDEATGLPYINARPVSIYPSWDPFAGISDFTGSTHTGSEESWADKVSNLPETSEWDMAIDDAMVDVTEMGIREEDDREVFWRAVHDQAVAEMNGKGHLAAQGSTHTAVNFNGIEIPSQLPPAPGTVSCPSGKVRVWHYTGSYESMGAILRTGLSRSNAQGSTYGEPNVIWCSSMGPPDVHGKAFVEFFMDPSEADINADLAQRDPNGARDYTLNVDRIGPDRFVTWSIPTLAYCRDLLGRKQQVAEGMYDTVDDPEAKTAVEWVKKHGKKISCLTARLKAAAIEASDPMAGLKDVLDTMDKTEHTHSGVIIKAIDSGRVLMTQRTPYAEDPEGVYGRWEFPGGSIDEGEDAFESALREFKEETGLDLPEDWAVEGCYENNKYLGIIVLVPHEAWTTNAEMLSHEVMGLGWFHPDQIEDTDLAREEVDKVEWDMVKEADKDPRFEGVALKEDDDGYYVTTHRARGDSYDTPEDIPQDEVDFIESTGSLHTAGGGWWHGSPSGRYEDGNTGIHVGTKQAATEALCARIGWPVEGTWDGTREYGKTLLMGKRTMQAHGQTPTGYNYRFGSDDDFYPDGKATFGDGSTVPMTAKPNIFQVEIIGEMTNTTAQPYDDFKANGYMSAAIKRGTPRKGYYYTNVGEDSGSVSAVVPPGGGHLRRMGSLADRLRTAAIEASDPLSGLVDVYETMEAKEHTHSGLIIKAIDSGRVLMTQRTPYAGDGDGVYGRWEFPGGSIDEGEDALESALREFGEETGLALPEDWAIEGCYENGKYLGIVILVPHEAWTTNATLLSHEVMGVGWFDPDLIEETELAREEISKTDWELVKEASAPTKLYHAAPKSARDSIAQHGLDWHIGNPGGSAPHGNFFHQSREAIDDMMSDGLSETHDLYEVDVKGLNLSFEVDPYQDDAVYEAEPIPASRVRRVASLEDDREDPLCDLCNEPMGYGTETATVTDYAKNGRELRTSVMHYGCAEEYAKSYGDDSKIVWPNGDVTMPKTAATPGITYQVDIEKTPDSLMPGVPDRATVHAFRGGHEVGTMQLNADFDAANNKSYRRWKIWNVWVDEDARRQGIAEGLVKALHDETPDMWVYHGGFMSAEGEAFGRKLVEKYPRWNKMASTFSEATLHEEPEAALPMTDGSREEVDDLFSPEAIAQRAAALGEDNSDIAAAADAYLAKTAVKVFSPKEQMDLIEEGAVEGVTASNLDRLDIEGTHYQALEERYRHLDASAQDLFL